MLHKVLGGYLTS